MTDYNKLWSNLIGAIVALVGAYFVIPPAFAEAWPVLTASLIPVVGGLIGTFIGPKNTN
jgi:hypothetical protein